MFDVFDKFLIWLANLPIGRRNWCPVCGSRCAKAYHRDILVTRWRFFAAFVLNELRSAVREATLGTPGEGPCIICGADAPEYDHAEDCDIATGLFRVTWYDAAHGIAGCADCGAKIGIGDTYCHKPVEGISATSETGATIGGLVVCSGCAVLAANQDGEAG